MTAPFESAAAVAVSDERFAPVRDGIELCYQTFGSPEDAPLLLIMGLGAPMTWWNPNLCAALVRAGFYVVRFDNRDAGRSTVLSDRVGLPALARAFAGRRVRAPYSISDLADDAFALLDHLGLDSTHVVGVSMGGMIAQTMAIVRPERVRSLTSMMSTTGRRSVGWQHPRLLPRMIAPRKPGREPYVAGAMAFARLTGSADYREPADAMRRRFENTWDRGVHPDGSARQMLAVLTQPDRGARLRELRVPSLVVHGLADKMVHVSGGRATAAAIPGAELLLIDGMGHDLPVPLHDTFVNAISRTADRSGITG